MLMVHVLTANSMIEKNSTPISPSNLWRTMFINMMNHEPSHENFVIESATANGKTSIWNIVQS